MSDTPLRVTPLDALHHELGARMVEFAGWSLPIQFEGIIAETAAARTGAALFDVSHMGVVDLIGPDVAEALEALTPAGVSTLQPGRMRYALLTNDQGGLVDDMMITRSESDSTGDRLTIVVNGARRAVDLPHLRRHLPDHQIIERGVDDDRGYALLALQGPEALAVLDPILGDLAELTFLQATERTYQGATIEVSRSGYTGEDGFELVVPAMVADQLARTILADDRARPAGLGARDALRLEAGLCLYGHDLDETTSPVEAGLVWSMPKRRREAGGFLGAERIQAELTNGPTRVRVGIAPSGRRPVRDGATLTTEDGQTIGIVTSGGYGPTVERPVAMGFVPPELAAIGTPLIAEVRGKSEPCVVADLPFTPHNYARGS